MDSLHRASQKDFWDKISASAEFIAAILVPSFRRMPRKA
jgi:hypothetical protein